MKTPREKQRDADGNMNNDHPKELTAVQKRFIEQISPAWTQIGLELENIARRTHRWQNKRD